MNPLNHELYVLVQRIYREPRFKMRVADYDPLAKIIQEWSDESFDQLSIEQAYSKQLVGKMSHEELKRLTLSNSAHAIASELFKKCAFVEKIENKEDPEKLWSMPLSDIERFRSTVFCLKNKATPKSHGRDET